jgi:hypothetical protein
MDTIAPARRQKIRLLLGIACGVVAIGCAVSGYKVGDVPLRYIQYFMAASAIFMSGCQFYWRRKGM